MKFSNDHIAVATTQDIAPITVLLNEAYRGEKSKQGWTSEAHLISGNIRTTENDLRSIISLPSSIILKYINGKNEIIGCVNLQKRNNKIYLGMLAVLPHLQGNGAGRQLLKAAEEYATSSECAVIYMTVISVRTELINWYMKYGYNDTGERKAFNEDGMTGKHKQPLEFIVLEKRVITDAG